MLLVSLRNRHKNGHMVGVFLRVLGMGECQMKIFEWLYISRERIYQTLISRYADTLAKRIGI